MAKATHLIGAYGMFWDRYAVDWDASRGKTYQLLGYRGDRFPKLEICDFRKARGIYILFDDFRATYVGRARGNEGLGTRLKKHTTDETKYWHRFCWFAFDTPTPIHGTDYWTALPRDSGARGVTADLAIDELEALMITAFGLTGTQRRMKFPAAREPWDQLTVAECLPGGIARREPNLIRMPSLREALAWED